MERAAADDFVGGVVWRTTDVMMVIVDDTDTVVAANPAVTRAAGAEPDELIGRNAAQLVVAPGAPAFLRALKGARESGLPYHQEHLFPTDDDDHLCIAWSIKELSREPERVFCVGVDVTAARSEFDAPLDRSVTDDLTGLPNRVGLVEKLALMSTGGATVVYCQLRNLDAIVSSVGRAAGDAVLVELARRLKRTARGEDFVARIGLADFVIVVPDPQSDLSMFAHRILRATDQPMIMPGPIVVTVGMTVGAGILEQGEAPEDVLSVPEKYTHLGTSRFATEAARAGGADT